MENTYVDVIADQYARPNNTVFRKVKARRARFVEYLAVLAVFAVLAALLFAGFVLGRLTAPAEPQPVPAIHAIVPHYNPAKLPSTARS